MISLIVLVLIVIAGVTVILYSSYGDAGENIEDESESRGNQLDCIMNNRENALDKCRDTEESSALIEGDINEAII